MVWTVKTLPFTEHNYMYITGGKCGNDAGSIRSYEAVTLEHALKVQEFQRKATDSEKICGNSPSFEAQHEPTKTIDTSIRHQAYVSHI
jgi:hypothetical protein